MVPGLNLGRSLGESPGGSAGGINSVIPGPRPACRAGFVKFRLRLRPQVSYDHSAPGSSFDRMLAYAIRRLLLMIPTLLGIMIINFVVIQAAPGGPVDVMIARIKGQASEATSRVGGSAAGDVAGERSTTPTAASGEARYR